MYKRQSLNVTAYCCLFVLLTLFAYLTEMSHITWTHWHPQTWTMLVRDGNPSQNFLRPTLVHTRPRGTCSRVGIPISRRRHADPMRAPIGFHISRKNMVAPKPCLYALFLTWFCTVHVLYQVVHDDNLCGHIFSTPEISLSGAYAKLVVCLNSYCQNDTYSAPPKFI